MTKPVTPQDMIELWQKMVNPTAYPLQSLMFPVLDAKELEKKIGELQVVEHWLRANIGMLQVSIKSLEYQRAMLKGGEKFSEQMRASADATAAPAGADAAAAPNPAMWAWDMMAKAGQDAMAQATQAAQAASPAKPKRKGKEKG